MIERDVVSWVVDIGTIVGILVAVWMAAKAIADSRETATALAAERRLLEAAQDRAEQEQAARVLSVAQDLRQRLEVYWQRGLVQQQVAPRPGEVSGFLRHAREDLGVAEELLLRSSGVDLTAVQYTRYVCWRLESVVQHLEEVDRAAQRASPGGGAAPHAVQQHKEHWESLRVELIGRTVEMIEVLQWVDAHFPAAARLMQGTDAQGFLEDLHHQLQEGRDAKIRAVIQNVRALGLYPGSGG